MIDKALLKNNAKVARGCVWGFMAIIAVLIGIVGVLVASAFYTPGAPTTLQVPESTSPEVSAILNASWPKVLTACPGLELYKSDLTYDGTEDNFNYVQEADRRVTVRYTVADKPSQVPNAFTVNGHTCTLEIPPSGRVLIISKRPCAALCRDDAAMLNNQPETVIGLR